MALLPHLVSHLSVYTTDIKSNTSQRTDFAIIQLLVHRIAMESKQRFQLTKQG